MKRLIYFCYYIWKLNWNVFLKFLNFTSTKHNRTYIWILFDLVKSSFKHNISILEYFQFHFIELAHLERSKWAGTGFMYEFQKAMNPLKYRYLLEDKTIFYKDYSGFMKHIVADLKEVKDNKKLLKKILLNPSRKIVLKIKDGGCGIGIQVRQASEFSEESLVKFMEDNKYDLVEEFIIQHPTILNLAPSAVNTIRIITQLDKDNNVVIIAGRIRLSVRGFVDNLAAGNIAAAIDLETGVIDSYGVFSNIVKEDTNVHPVSGKCIKGTIIPYWQQVLNMAKEAALVNPINKSVGWDIALTPNGPTLIEGNREWCKLLFQLPAKKGLKNKLEKYLESD